MKHRTQILFEPEEHRYARRRAAEEGVSLSEYVRRLVRRDHGARPAGDPSSLIGLGHSGGSDVARFKDDYVGEAVEAEHPRK
ncbi:MAG: hypothetical protein ACRDGJ_01395 [Candidatus Limnocylindria bacterium]